MLYLKTFLFCGIFSHFFLNTESDLLKGILLGSALNDDDSGETEILVIRIPKQRNLRKESGKSKLQTSTTTSTSTTSTISSTPVWNTWTTERTSVESKYGTTDKFANFLEPFETNVKPVNSTPELDLKGTEYSTQTTVTTNNICGENKTFTQCLNECGNRCNDMDDEKLCPAHCFGFGCTCAPNFVRDVRNDRCIKPIDCPKPIKCSVGERFYLCGGCGATCEIPVPVCHRICRVEGSCDCVSGLVRNVHGKCVPLSLCPLSNSRISLESKFHPNYNFTQKKKNILEDNSYKKLLANSNPYNFVY